MTVAEEKRQQRLILLQKLEKETDKERLARVLLETRKLEEGKKRIIRLSDPDYEKKVTPYQGSPLEYRRKGKAVPRVSFSDEIPKNDTYTMNGLESKVEKEKGTTFWKGPTGEKVEYVADVPLHHTRYPLK